MSDGSNPSIALPENIAYRSSARRRSTLMTIVKNAPRKVTNAIDISCVGQNMIDAGTHASGGIGRSTSNTGKPMP